MSELLSPLFERRLRTPRSAAAAGILFALLLGTAFAAELVSRPVAAAEPGLQRPAEGVRSTP